MLPIQDDDQEDAATSDNRSDTGQSPLAQSPTPFDDDSDDSGAPTVIADSDTGQLDSELDVGLDYLTPFTAVGTVGSRQGDVAEASGSAVAAPAATSSSAMPGSDRCQSPLAQSPTPIHDDSDDSPAPTVIAVGLGTVGSRQGDVAEAYGSFLAALAATSFSAMPASRSFQ